MIAKLLVLVPGFFSSFAQPYFSDHIVSHLERQGYTVEVVQNLNPIGKVSENSQSTLDSLQAIAKKHSHQPMTIIGHSLGGIYSLVALNTDKTLPVQNVVTIATPYEGVGIVNGIDANFPGVSDLADFLHLESLVEMRTANVQAILKKYPIPENVRWIALGGYEKRCLMLTCAWPERLSWIMSVGQFFIGRDPSDGIVTTGSALAINSKLKIERWQDMVVPLEHWEMVLDHRVFGALGVANTSWIHAQQIQLYSNILKRL